MPALRLAVDRARAARRVGRAPLPERHRPRRRALPRGRPRARGAGAAIPWRMRRGPRRCGATRAPRSGLRRSERGAHRSSISAREPGRAAARASDRSISGAISSRSPIARRTRSDLGGLRLRAEDRAPRPLRPARPRGHLGGREPPRRGSWSSSGRAAAPTTRFGNFVGTGDYDLVVTVSSELERVARAATSARRWSGSSARRASGAARALGFDFESRGAAARRGCAARDPAGRARAPCSATRRSLRGSVLQRLEAELAPALVARGAPTARRAPRQRGPGVRELRPDSRRPQR